MRNSTHALLLVVVSMLWAQALGEGNFLSRIFGDSSMSTNGGNECPPPGFDAIPDSEFDLERYISETWYTAKQIPIVFQPEDSLYCVKADYVPIDPNDPLAGVYVNNYANEGEVNGPQVGTNIDGSFPGTFIAVPEPSQRSKLNVGFALPGSDVPANVGSNYWVVALDKDNYSWAVIVSGAPDTPSGDGCIQNNGFWLFVRDPKDQSAAAAAEAAAKELGLDTSALLPVEQDGCLYQAN